MTPDKTRHHQIHSIVLSLPSKIFKDLTYCIQRFDENQDLQKETLRNRTRLRDDDNGLASVLIHTFTTLRGVRNKNDTRCNCIL